MSRLILLAWVCMVSPCVLAQTLEKQLQSVQPGALAEQSRQSGDARRGAILFHQVHIGCVKCHAVDGSSNSLGPDLTQLGRDSDASDEYIAESLLKPSEKIRKGFEAITVVTTDGRSQTGLLVKKDEQQVVLRDPANNGQRVTIDVAEVEEIATSRLSIMPSGIVNQLADRQQFLDLLRYVLELKNGGLDAARKLKPPPGLIAFQLPEYEERIDHAGLIRKLDDDSFRRGEEIYNRLCINCHGNKERPGSLPTALRFGEGKFRSGGDPYTMYRTLTHGFGLMVPQTWMVPQQKYDVVHYIREAYVREENTAQYMAVNADYLSSLPKGDTFGPEPVEYAPWSDMNYGPSMINTFEVGADGRNFAYKGIAIRLDPGPGGIAKGSKWAVFDHDTLRIAAAWTRERDSREAGFINWQGIHFDGRHGAHPRITGELQFENPTGPGWARPDTDNPEELFADDERVRGRDGRRYGPLPKHRAEYHGLHTIGERTIIEYSVARRRVLEEIGCKEFHVDRGSDQGLSGGSSETPESATDGNRVADVFTRSLNVASGGMPNVLLVATHPQESVAMDNITSSSVLLKPTDLRPPVLLPSQFDGDGSLLIREAAAFDMTSADFTITARIRTSGGGTVFCKTKADGPWVPNGKSFFVRGGRLCYDIGWVGVVQSKQKVDDNKWHDVAMTWTHDSGTVAFYIDGNYSGGGTLRPKSDLPDEVAKIGFSAANFPNPSPFTGEISHVAFWQKALSAKAVSQYTQQENSLDEQPQAAWDLNGDAVAGSVMARGTNPADATLVKAGQATAPQAILAGVIAPIGQHQWTAVKNRLCVSVPAADSPQDLVVWTVRVAADTPAPILKRLVADIEDRVKVDRLSSVVVPSSSKPWPASIKRWPEVISTVPMVGPSSGPFAIDVLTTPVANPWLARIRLTGHDFFDDGNRVAVCSWDGDVWLVSGLKSLENVPSAEEQPQLKWQRIASGLFQPLGLKVVAEDVYVMCRDQLVILRDRNGDGETDFYECFNNDHQVTEHFHEFAMGLQQDEIGNFYYAKSARHALKAIVPHHGTLLRIPSDGSRTDILATGFRAANGVCLNPDGSFIVTDQEGHWNPKNRINWVREGGFYGNMFGYHDVTDESDDAMEQPLCWITNAFDRSPAELMWIHDDQWGPLNGSLLNLSYGYGKVYIVPHENSHGQMQGGMCELPIPQFPTGIARGRISPHDHGLYLSGMFAWGSSQQSQEGGFYRLRYTGKPAHLPVVLRARRQQLQIEFSDVLDKASASDVASYHVKVWSLKRSANYGSKHYDETDIDVTAAALSDDGRTVTLTIPDLAPTWCMEVRCQLKSASGESFERVIHNTIHRVD